MSTLLEKALEHSQDNFRSRRDTFSAEHLELAIAWAEGLVTTAQVCAALGFPQKNRGSIYNFAATRLAYAVKCGLLIRKAKGE